MKGVFRLLGVCWLNLFPPWDLSFISEKVEVFNASMPISVLNQLVRILLRLSFLLPLLRFRNPPLKVTWPNTHSTTRISAIKIFTRWRLSSIRNSTSASLADGIGSYADGGKIRDIRKYSTNISTATKKSICTTATAILPFPLKKEERKMW